MPSILDLLCGCADPVAAPKRSSGPATASSAPEPLGKTVSVPACEYQADSTDSIDSQFALYLASFDRASMASLLISRIQPSEYEIDGRRVRLYFPEKQGLYSDGNNDEPLVHEYGTDQRGNSEEPNTPDTPLSIYLRQVVNIAASLQGRTEGAPAVARIPTDKRMTFAPMPPIPPAEKDPLDERVREMRVACEQARLRQYAAEQYERAGQPRQPHAVQVHKAQLPRINGVYPNELPLRACSHGSLPVVALQNKVNYAGAIPARASSQGCLPVAPKALPAPPPAVPPERGRMQSGARPNSASLSRQSQSISLASSSSSPLRSRRNSPTRVPPTGHAAPIDLAMPVPALAQRLPY